MAYVTPDLAVTGNFITAADGNRRRDNDEYLKGRAGPIAVENSVAVSGSLSASSTVFATGAIQTGPSASNQYQWHDRTTGAIWVLYADSGWAHWYSAAVGVVLSFNYATGALQLRDQIDNAIVPGHLHQTALAGFLRAGAWTYSYNGDGTIAYQLMNAAGPLNGCAITYEYSGGLVVAQRLRVGGVGGTVIASIGYTYDGSSRISTESHS